MITTSVPRSGCSRVTTAPPARIGRLAEGTASFRLRAVLTGGTVRLLRCGAAPARGVDQVLLHVQQRLTVGVGGVWNPCSIRLQLPRRRSLVERDLEQLLDLTDVCWIGDRNQHLYAAVQVAVHEVGGADADRWRSIVGKPKEPAVLEEGAEDATHSDVLAETEHAGSDRTDSAYPQVDRDAGPRGAVERIGGRLVHDGVDLDLDACRLTVLMVGDLVVDSVDQAVADTVRGDQQPLVLGLLSHSRQMVEQPADVFGDDGVGGEQPDVLVQPRGLGVVVARSDVRVTAQTVGLVTYHH